MNWSFVSVVVACLLHLLGLHARRGVLVGDGVIW